jgi:hypothetical protein
MTSRLRTTETDGREMVRAILRGVSVCVCVCVCTCGWWYYIDPWLRVCSAVRQCTRGKRMSPLSSLAGADNRVFPRTGVWHGGVGFGTVWGCFVGFVEVPAHFAPTWRGVDGQAHSHG